MNLKNKFCRSVDLATLTPPLTKISGSAPVNHNHTAMKLSLFFSLISTKNNKNCDLKNLHRFYRIRNK